MHTDCLQLNNPNLKMSTDKTIVRKIVRICERQRKKGISICLSILNNNNNGSKFHHQMAIF